MLADNTASAWRTPGRRLRRTHALGGTETLEVLYRPAHKLGARVGISRAAVDACRAPVAHRARRTDKTMAPELHLATDICAAIEQVIGIKDAPTIIARNKDPGRRIGLFCPLNPVSVVRRCIVRRSPAPSN